MPDIECETLEPLRDPTVGLSGFLAVHTTRRGPVFGGIRVVPYDGSEACRLDAARLAVAMTRKCVFHEIPGGGAKIALDRSAIVDRRAVMLAVGDLVESMAGRFFTGTDTGSTEIDLEVVAERTRHVSREQIAGATADGLLHAVRAACDVEGLAVDRARVFVQGLGAVGLRIAAALVAAGARVAGCDTQIDARTAAEAAGVEIIDPSGSLLTACDIFCPCALGGVIDDAIAGTMDCRLVVGAANNVLATDRAGDILHGRGIVFVPDYVANGGGLIRGAWVHLRGTPGTAAEIASIGDRTVRLLDSARRLGESPSTVAARWIEAGE